MKKIFFIVCLWMLAFSLFGCSTFTQSGSESTKEETAKSKKKKDKKEKGGGKKKNKKEKKEEEDILPIAVYTETQLKEEFKEGYDWETSESGVFSSLDRFIWEDTGYPYLEEILETENRKAEERNLAWSEEAMRVIREEEDQFYSMGDSFYLERADSRIFGFINMEEESNQEMENIRVKSYNFLPESGEKLLLRDFVSDYDALAERIVKGIREIYQEPYQKAGEERPFNEAEAREYILNALETIDDEENLYAMSWVMDETGLLFGFYNLKDIGATELYYSPIRVQIPYHELEGILKEEALPYTELPQEYITEILPYTEYVLESGGEEIRLLVEPVKEEVESYVYESGKVNISVNKNQFLTQDTDYGTPPNKIVLAKRGGEFYLYMDFSLESYSEIRAYRLTPEGAQELEMIEGSFAYAPTDIDMVLVEHTVWLYGTSYVYKNFRVGEEGGLEDLGDEYYGYNFYRDIINRFPVEVDVFEDQFDTEASKETLPELTKLRQYRTDGENFVDFLTEDGRVIRLYKDQSFDGKSDYDAFYGIYYAG
ncbi:MAG: hypothetical protein Q4A19_02670 [Johnsonella sp.]|nr:hypothetical protein [Johnsonella sp.]